MNQVLNSKFEDVVHKDRLMHHLQVMPLTVLSIMDLELFEPYIQDKPLNARLDEWLDWREDNPRTGFTAYMHDLIHREQRNNQFMDQGFDRFYTEGEQYFLSRGLT